MARSQAGALDNLKRALKSLFRRNKKGTKSPDIHKGSSTSNATSTSGSNLQSSDDQPPLPQSQPLPRTLQKQQPQSRTTISDEKVVAQQHLSTYPTPPAVPKHTPPDSRAQTPVSSQAQHDDRASSAVSAMSNTGVSPVTPVSVAAPPIPATMSTEGPIAEVEEKFPQELPSDAVHHSGAESASSTAGATKAAQETQVFEAQTDESKDEEIVEEDDVSSNEGPGLRPQSDPYDPHPGSLPAARSEIQAGDPLTQNPGRIDTEDLASQQAPAMDQSPGSAGTSPPERELSGAHKIDSHTDSTAAHTSTSKISPVDSKNQPAEAYDDKIPVLDEPSADAPPVLPTAPGMHATSGPLQDWYPDV